MKTNNENILKYLAEVMDDNTRIIFEEEISKSAVLKDQLADTKKQLFDLKVDNGILDERYFNKLLPTVRQKLEKKKPQFAEKIYYLVPYVAGVIVGLLFLFKPAYNFDNEYKDLAGKVVNNMTDNEVAAKYFDELDSEPTYLETAEDNNSLSSLIPSNLDFNSEAASNMLNGTVLDEYGNIYGFSDDQLKTIAANLDKLNIK